MDKETRREIIMDNYQNPMNRGLKNDGSYILKNTNAESCIDNIDMMMKVENGIIKDICFDGEACAICTSATSIIIRKLMGKTLVEANAIISNFQNMINEKEYDKDLMGELLVYEDLYLQPSRKNCALLPSNAVLKIFKEVDDK